jgi:maltose alpha-D-glucosyltransferase/alpha-amylase
MQWTSDRNSGFSRADYARLYAPVIADPVYGYQSINVEAQERTRSSMLNWVKRLLRVRQRYPAFAMGKLRWVNPDNRKVIAFTREFEGQTILIICNLSRFAQPAVLDLREWEGQVPVELIGETPFPRISGMPYQITLGPYNFLWFRLEKLAPGRGMP